MSDNIPQSSLQGPAPPQPPVSFVSLGCPKALVDTERIITPLRAEGYALSREHGARISSSSTPAASSTARRRNRSKRSARRWPRTARSSSPAAWAPSRRRSPTSYPNALAITGPQQYESVVDGGASRGAAAARPVPRSGAAAGHQAHAAPLRLSEDFRRLQQPLHVLHHPEAARRSRLAPGRRRAARGRAAGRGRRQGIAGHLAGHLGLRRRHQIRREPGRSARCAPVPRSGARAWRARRLGAAALRLSLPACRRRHPADGRGQGPALSRHPVPARQPDVLKRMQRPAAQEKTLDRIRRWREICPDLPSARPSSSDSPARPRRISRCCSTGSTKPSSTASAASNTSR